MEKYAKQGVPATVLRFMPMDQMPTVAPAWDPWMVHFHLPTLGPTASWLLMTAAFGLKELARTGGGESKLALPAIDVADELGVNQSVLYRTISRLCGFRMMGKPGDDAPGVYRVRLFLPPLRSLERNALPPHVRRVYDNHAGAFIDREPAQ